MLTNKNKLVRDYIPQLIRQGGKKVTIKSLSTPEYQKALLTKLVEEAREAARATNLDELIEEIADVYEVIDALLTSYNLDREVILAAQVKKKREKGGFAQKLQLTSSTPSQLSLATLSEKETKLLATLKDDLQAKIAPQAALIDRQPAALKQALQGMGELSLLALRVPEKWGGMGISELGFRHFQMMMARYSGALAFLQTQHQSAASMLLDSTNELLKQQYLKKMGTGEVLIGVGFSQLRRQGKPMMKAIPVDRGYELSGEVPWLTGYGFFPDFIIGGTLPDGQELYAIAPCQDSQQANGGKITFTQPMELVSMNSTNTVSAKLERWFISSDELVSIKAAHAIHVKDCQNVLHHGFFSLGCAQAGLDILATNAHKKQLPFMEESFQKLSEELTCIRQEMLRASISPDCTFEEKLQLRVQAINLALRCASTAVISSSGAANYQTHPAGRVYREALLFSVSGQTTAVMEASLKLLANSGK
jgi:predicted house-cleaning noncanonical NTP pyrophosphatase (MazG superfamily)